MPRQFPITIPLRMLQLNILGFKAQMEALINDTETQDLDILLIQEPLTCPTSCL